MNLTPNDIMRLLTPRERETLSPLAVTLLGALAELTTPESSSGYAAAWHLEDALDRPLGLAGGSDGEPSGREAMNQLLGEQLVEEVPNLSCRYQLTIRTWQRIAAYAHRVGFTSAAPAARVELAPTSYDPARFYLVEIGECALTTPGTSLAELLSHAVERNWQIVDTDRTRAALAHFKAREARLEELLAWHLDHGRPYRSLTEELVRRHTSMPDEARRHLAIVLEQALNAAEHRGEARERERAAPLLEEHARAIAETEGELQRARELLSIRHAELADAEQEIERLRGAFAIDAPIEGLRLDASLISPAGLERSIVGLWLSRLDGRVLRITVGDDEGIHNLTAESQQGARIVGELQIRAAGQRIKGGSVLGELLLEQLEAQQPDPAPAAAPMGRAVRIVRHESGAHLEDATTGERLTRPAELEHLIGRARAHGWRIIDEGLEELARPARRAAVELDGGDRALTLGVDVPFDDLRLELRHITAGGLERRVIALYVDRDGRPWRALVDDERSLVMLSPADSHAGQLVGEIVIGPTGHVSPYAAPAADAPAAPADAPADAPRRVRMMPHEHGGWYLVDVETRERLSEPHAQIADLHGIAAARGWLLVA